MDFIFRSLGSITKIKGTQVHLGFSRSLWVHWSHLKPSDEAQFVNFDAFFTIEKEKPFLPMLLMPVLLHFMTFLGSSFRSLLLSTSSEVLMKYNDPKTCFMLSQIILSI